VTEERIAEHRGDERGALIMPFYLVCDVSLSMEHDMPVLNRELQDLHQSIASEPVLDDVGRICVMTFSDSASVVLPLTQLSESKMPTLTIQGGTNYGAAFRLIADTITRDNKDLLDRGFKVFRPCVFFLTDGEPTDDNWLQTFGSTLTYDSSSGHGMKGHPIFIPFGFRDARRTDLAKLAYPPHHGKWYLSGDQTPTEAIKGILHIIMNTMVTGGRSVNTPNPGPVPQPPPAGSPIVQGDYDLNDPYLC
jgi:uncharacterized protein YegL